MEFNNWSAKELLKFQAETLSELKSRGIIRTANKPTGDLAEFLFCKAFNWSMSSNSQKGFDAKCLKGFRYQIKARQIIRGNQSERQLSAIRGLENNLFDYIAAVLFKADYSIYRAALIPYRVIVDSDPSYSAHDNKYIFHLTDDIWQIEGVSDVTDSLCRALDAL